MQSGYSGTALIKKLGIKENQKIKLVNMPEAYFEWLENDIRRQLCKKNELPDFVHLFAKDNKTFVTCNFVGHPTLIYNQLYLTIKF